MFSNLLLNKVIFIKFVFKLIICKCLYLCNLFVNFELIINYSFYFFLFLLRPNVLTPYCRITTFCLLNKSHLWSKWYAIYSMVLWKCWRGSIEHDIHVSRTHCLYGLSLWPQGLRSIIPGPICFQLTCMARDPRKTFHRPNYLYDLYFLCFSSDLIFLTLKDMQIKCNYWRGN